MLRPDRMNSTPERHLRFPWIPQVLAFPRAILTAKCLKHPAPSLKQNRMQKIEAAFSRNLVSSCVIESLTNEETIAAYINDVIASGDHALINEAFKNIQNAKCR
jgi:hypothetical protein